MRDVELEEIKEYATEDADITFQLRTIYRWVRQNRNHKATKLRFR
jgi:IS30 family transposase